MQPAADPSPPKGCNFFGNNAINHSRGRRSRAVRQLAVELHVPADGIAIRNAIPGNTVQDKSNMSGRKEGQQDTNVLMQLRQLGLHPAVRVFEPDATRSWIKRPISDLMGEDGDHEPLLRLVTNHRSA
jgi:hypothetical protein